MAVLVPDAGLSAPVETVWLTEAADSVDRLSTAGAQIALPTSSNAAGWFALSAVPGEPGSAVLVGHVDTVSGPAVFTRLTRVHEGMTVSLIAEDARETVYAVDAIWRHPAGAPAPAELFALDGPPRLYLVTCTGQFIRSAGGYQDRLIVSAALLPPPEPSPPEAETA